MYLFIKCMWCFVRENVLRLHSPTDPCEAWEVVKAFYIYMSNAVRVDAGLIFNCKKYVPELLVEGFVCGARLCLDTCFCVPTLY